MLLVFGCCLHKNSNTLITSKLCIAVKILYSIYFFNEDRLAESLLKILILAESLFNIFFWKEQTSYISKTKDIKERIKFYENSIFSISEIIEIIKTSNLVNTQAHNSNKLLNKIRFNVRAIPE